MKIFRLIVIYIFKIFFTIKPFKKHYYGVYKRIIYPYNLCSGIHVNFKYDNKFKIKLNLEDWIQQQIFFLNYFDSRGINFLKKNLKPGDNFIDVGANIGTYTLIASDAVSKKGNVFAFEPASDTFKKLEFNVTSNNLKNVVLEKMAVSDEICQKELVISPVENIGMSSFYNNEFGISNVEIVECINIDTYLTSKNIKSLKMIKIDIEGAEFEALKGMKETIEKYKPYVFIEINSEILSSLNKNATEIEVFFNALNYTRYLIAANGDISKDFEYKDAYENYVFISNKMSGVHTL